MKTTWTSCSSSLEASRIASPQMLNTWRCTSWLFTNVTRMTIMSRSTRFLRSSWKNISNTRLFPYWRARKARHFSATWSRPGKPTLSIQRWWIAVSSTWTDTTWRIISCSSWVRSACRCFKIKSSLREKARSQKPSWRKSNSTVLVMLLTRRSLRSAFKCSSIWASLSPNQWRLAKGHLCGKAIEICRSMTTSLRQSSWSQRKKRVSSLPCSGTQAEAVPSTWVK